MRRQVIIAAIGAVLLTALFFMLLIRPKMNEITETRKEVEAAQEEGQSLRNRIAQLEAAREEAPATAARLERLSSLLPADPDLPGFIRALQRAATVSGVDLNSIAPSEPSGIEQTVNIQQISVNVSIQGSFRRTEEMLSRVENLRRVVEISSISLTPTPDPETGQILLSGSLTMRMYVVGPGARAAVPAGGGAQNQGGSS